MKAKKQLRGKLSLHHKGFGFVKPEGNHEDVFIPPTKIRGALDGDIVLVTSLKKSQKGWEGSIKEVIDRGRKKVVGTVVDFYTNGDAMLFSPLAGEERPFNVKKSPKTKLKIGDRVLVNVRSQTEDGFECTVSKVLGNIDNALIDTEVSIEEFELSAHFPTMVNKEAEKFSSECKLTKDREDLRDLECITIDPKTARDYDDALSVTKDKKGCYHVGVHIADVSHYVKVGSKLDEEAKKRGNSTYFLDRVVPMLPERLSNDLCSLKEGVDRYTASVLIEFDAKGNVKSHRLVKGIIRSRKRFSYEEARLVLDRKLKSPHLKTLKLLVDLCKLLKRQKRERGCVELALPEIRLVLDETGVPYTEDWIEYDITHQLVEEFMLKANEIVATELSKQKKKAIYRIHEDPDQENLNEFYTLARLLGFNISKDEPNEISKVFEEAKGSPFLDQLSQRYIRTMKLAIYSKKNSGHYGLNLENYTHFTSPIRRYTDLVVHRLIFEKGYSPNVEEIAAICSETERRSFRAEMSVQRLKKLRYLDRLTEEDHDITFEATITNVKSQGIIFDLGFIGFEGNIHVSDLGDDYYQFNEKERAFIGSNTREKFQLGSKIVVQLETIDLVFGECTWNLVH